MSSVYDWAEDAPAKGHSVGWVVCAAFAVFMLAVGVYVGYVTSGPDPAARYAGCELLSDATGSTYWYECPTSRKGE